MRHEIPVTLNALSKSSASHVEVDQVTGESSGRIGSPANHSRAAQWGREPLAQILSA